MKRIALECIVGSTSIITKNRFGWNIKTVGTLHLVNGIIVIPVSIFSGYLSTLYEDRYLAIWFLSITLFGMAFLLDISDYVNHEDSGTYNEGEQMAVGPRRYIAGSLIAFSGIEACESYVASLMSKVVPSPLAEGTFNSGLLATLVATVRCSHPYFPFILEMYCTRFLLTMFALPSLTGRDGDWRSLHLPDGIDQHSKFAQPTDHSWDDYCGIFHCGDTLQLRPSCSVNEVVMNVY
jgi:hypothetical protein